VVDNYDKYPVLDLDLESKQMVSNYQNRMNYENNDPIQYVNNTIMTLGHSAPEINK